MKKSFFFTLALALGASSMSFAQPPRGAMPNDATLKGHVVEAASNAPMEYANIALYRLRDSSLVTGTVTGPDGAFKLENLSYGRFYLTANFIGFERAMVDGVILNPRNKLVTLETIELVAASTELDEAVVTAEHSHMNFKLDRKIVNVGQDATSAGGTAVDVLQNTPSVEVDIEGNVSIRGSSNFTVLIDGKPSVLDGNDALQQLPASTIESIEIITNPSAKYDPEGVGGIINVILKKQKRSGLNGIVNVSAGTGDKYTGDVTLNYRNEKFNLYGGLDYTNYSFDGTQLTRNETYDQGNTLFRNTNGERDMKRDGYKGQLGFDYFLTDRVTLSLSGDRGHYGFGFDNEVQQVVWSDLNPEKTQSLNLSENERNGDYYSLNFMYDHRLDDKGQKLEVMVNWFTREGDNTNEQFYYNFIDEQRAEDFYQANRNLSEDTRGRLRAKADYTLPFNDNEKLEAGYQMQVSGRDQSSLFHDYVAESNDWQLNQNYSNAYEFSRHIEAAYVTYSNVLWEVNYMLGLRGEYTNREIQNKEMTESYSIDRFDYFPSLHLSKNVTESTQLLASYSRRIRRPRGWYLDPLLQYQDEFSYRQGNPDLEPEYINSYEFALQQRIGKAFVNLEAYYRETQNKISRIKNIYEGETFIETFDNLSSDQATGLELSLNWRALKWLSMNASANVYDYRITGDIVSSQTATQNTNWGFRSNLNITLPADVRLQLTGFYRGPSITAQGESEGFFMTNMAVRKDFMDKRLTATLQVRDVFGQMSHEFTSRGDQFYSFNRFERESPVVNFTISYKINNYKDRGKKKGDDMEMDFDTGEF
ncbi:MAG: TonB-dependent receptor domain-containing protein [Bacteroidota bacterium]